MKTFDIVIGKGRNPMTLDAGEVLGTCLLIQGARKSGKSYLARVLMEQTIPKMQTIVLDADGEFSTLREKFKLLIAGPDGDVPCEVRSAKLLARRIAETGVSAVVDFSDLPLNHESPDDRRLFVKEFLHEFNNLPKSMYDRPRLFVIDEAHVYCPEKGQGTAASTQEVVLLQSQGRKRGYGAVLLTQRLSKLKNDAASECGTILIGKTSPIDTARATDLLGLERKERDSLKRLKPGTFYGDGNALPIEEPVKFQVCKSQTTHLEPGARHEMTTPPPQRAIKKILAEFEALPPPKDVEDAENLSEAQDEIRRLTRILAKAEKGSGIASDKEFKSLERRLDKAMAAVDDALEAGTQRERRRIAKPLQRVPGSIRSILKMPLSDAADAMDALEKLAVAVETMLKAPAPTDLSLKERPGRKIDGPKPKGRMTRRVPTGGTTSHLANNLPFSRSSAPGKLLTVLIQWNEHLGKSRTAALAGIRFKSSTFRNALTKMRQVDRLIEENGSDIWVTEEAHERYKDMVEALPSGDALISGWRGRFGGVPLAIFDALIEAGGSGPREEICESAGTDPDSSTARNAYTKLRKVGLLESSPGDLQLSDHVLEAMD